MVEQITMVDLVDIYRMHGAKLSPSDMLSVLSQCNEQADVSHIDIWGKPTKPRSASDWAHFFAMQDAEEQSCDYNH